jgi:tetratricopeptide (TPR) repeat protein
LEENYENEDLRDNEIDIIFYLIKAWILRKKKEESNIFKTFDNVLQLISKINLESIDSHVLISKFVMNFYIETAEFYFGINKGETAYYYLEKTLQIAKQYSNYYYIYASYTRYLNFINLKTDLSLFNKIAQEYINYFSKQDKLTFSCLSYYMVSRVLYRQSKLKLSLEYIKKALTFAKKFPMLNEGEVMWLADIYNSLGNINCTMGNFSEAEKITDIFQGLIENDYSDFRFKQWNKARYEITRTTMLIEQKSTKTNYQAQELLQNVLQSRALTTDII